MTEATRLITATELDDDSATVPNELADFFKSLEPDGADALVQVFEVDGTDRGYLFSFSPAATDATGILDHLLKEFGPGLYQLLPRGARGQMRGGGRKVRVGPIQGVTRLPRGPLASLNADKPPASDNSAIDALTRQVQQLAGVVGQMQQQPPQKSTLETLQEYAEMRKMFEPAQSAGLDASGMLGLFRELLQFKNEIAGDGGDGENPLLVAAKNLAPVLTKALETMQHAPPQPQPQLLAPPIGDAAKSRPVDPVGKLIGPYLPHLLQYASAGVSPGIVARQALQQLYQNLDAQRLGALIAWLDNDDAVDRLVTVDARVAQHRAWADRFVDALIQQVRADAEQHNAPGGDAADQVAMDDEADPGTTPAAPEAGLVREVPD